MKAWKGSELIDFGKIPDTLRLNLELIVGNAWHFSDCDLGYLEEEAKIFL